jgi:hypothetical protein
MLERSIRFLVISSVTIAGFSALVSCDEFLAEPTRRATRSVQSPIDNASASGEIMGPSSDAVPLVSVNFGNKRDEPPTVTTILDPLRTTVATRPGTSTTTRPTVELPASTETPLRVAGSRNPDDVVALTIDQEGNAVVRVTTRAAAGSITLQRTGEAWPPILHVYFLHADNSPLTQLASFSATESPAGESSTPAVELRSAIIQKEGRADVRVPGFSRASAISLQWVEKPQ